MLLSSFFVFDFKTYDALADAEFPPNAFLCFRIKDDMLSGLDRPFKKLFLSRHKNRFCFLIDVAQISSSFEKVIESLVPLTFCYSYIKFNCDSPLIVFESASEDLDEYVERGRKIFKSHGYNDIEVKLLTSSHGLGYGKKKERNIRILGKNSTDLSIEYMDAVRETIASDSCPFFFLDSPDELPRILNSVIQAEVAIWRDAPQVCYLLEENTIRRNREQEMLSQMGLIREQLSSQNNYHLYYNAADTRYKRQITELLSFYKNEYEILPLWYKRFGHIIKVLMGKRTFHSLFSDKVKKYTP